MGYDHNYVLRAAPAGQPMRLAARVTEPTSGRTMEVRTTEPGVQFYTGNFLDGTIKNRKGVPYQKHAAFCLETQHFPDSVNQPQLPVHDPRAGQDVPDDDGVRVRGEVGVEIGTRSVGSRQ